MRYITRVDPELKPERPELFKLDTEGMTEENRRLYYKNLERIKEYVLGVEALFENNLEDENIMGYDKPNEKKGGFLEK